MKRLKCFFDFLAKARREKNDEVGMNIAMIGVLIAFVAVTGLEFMGTNPLLLTAACVGLTLMGAGYLFVDLRKILSEIHKKGS